MTSDLRYALRLLWKRPWFTFTAVLIMALGIGANTAIFSVVDAVLLHPLPYGEPQRLVVALEKELSTGQPGAVSPAAFLDWSRQATSFESMAAAVVWSPTLQGDDKPEELAGHHLSPNMMSVLGVQPALGRAFSSTDERAVILSDRFWHRKFGGDRHVLGRTLVLSGEPHTIIGVMPPSFSFAPFWSPNGDVWAPLQFTPKLAQDRGARMLRVFARLKPNVTLEQAQKEMDVVAAQIAQAYPKSNTGVGVALTELHEMAVGRMRPILLTLLGAVGLILLIACANLANLLLSRATSRHREIAVRLALGATRLQLIRQLLTESALLSLAGGVAGLILAAWTVSLLTTASIPERMLPRQNEIGIDATAILFALGLSTLTGLVFGLIPALQASRPDVNESLKDGGRGITRSSRTRSALVVAEIALSLMLVTGAGLMLRSLHNLSSVDPGFHSAKVLSMEMHLAGSAHATPGQRDVFYREVLEKARALPGVQSASLINHLPITGDLWNLDVEIEGRPAPAPGQQPTAAYRVVSPGYFDSMGIVLLRGRDFQSSDVEGRPGVAIVNGTMARAIWPNENAIGKRFRRPSGAWMEVVGVVKDVTQQQWASQPQSEMYLPLAQDADHLRSAGGQWLSMTLVLRASSNPLTLVNPARDAIWSVDRSVPLTHVGTMDRFVADATWQPRFSTFLVAAFAALALLLAAVGIYGVMSFAVTLRTSEIGIRMALGARQADVLLMILGRSMMVSSIGIVLGLAGALVLTQFLRTQLYDVSASDPLTFCAVTVLLMLVALFAAYLPARRAARLDPLIALRYE